MRPLLAVVLVLCALGCSRKDVPADDESGQNGKMPVTWRGVDSGYRDKTEVERQ